METSGKTPSFQNIIALKWFLRRLNILPCSTTDFLLSYTSSSTQKTLPGSPLSWSHLSQHGAARHTHRGPDRSTHILPSHPSVLKGNGRMLSRLWWGLRGGGEGNLSKLPCRWTRDGRTSNKCDVVIPSTSHRQTRNQTACGCIQTGLISAKCQGQTQRWHFTNNDKTWETSALSSLRVVCPAE